VNELVAELDITEFARRHAEGSILTLDVREPYEVAIAALPGAVHIPMRHLPSRLHEIDREREIAVICHHGGRSERAAAFLAARGFRSVYNVSGGIDAYARRIDPSIPIY
jgi:rhodanese-related sulfurtransferase